MVTVQQIEGLRPKLFQHARQYWGVGQEEAEDAAQCVVVRLWEKSLTIRAETLANYAMRTLQREMLSRRRAAACRPDSVLECDLGEDVTVLADLLSAPNAGGVLEGIGDSPAFKALMALPPSQSAAVFAIDVAELSYAEASVKCGTSVGNLRWRVWRGRQALRAALN